MIRVLICDDCPFVREGMKIILSSCEDLIVVEEAATCREALEKVRGESFDIALLDVKLPDRLGVDLIEEIIAEKPDLPVLMFSACSEEKFAVPAIKSGAAGYVMKTASAEEWIKAIRTVASGGKHISPTLASRIVDFVNCEAETLPHERLSSRELQVMYMLASGKDLSEVSKELHLSKKVLGRHQTIALEKMEMTNEVEFFRYAIKHDLMDC